VKREANWTAIFEFIITVRGTVASPQIKVRAGEVDPELARWWESFAQADADERHRLLNALRGRDGPRRAPRPDAKGRDAPAATEGRGATGESEQREATGEADAAPARKRRRRRRKPAGAAGEEPEQADLTERSPVE